MTGTWRTLGDAALLDACVPRLDDAVRSGISGRERILLGGRAGILKYGPLRGKARWRHAARMHALRASLPRLREFENLAWLRSHGYGAPEPLLAAALVRRGLPVFQALVTEEVAGARTLRELLEDGASELRKPAIEALGRLVAGLHSDGFVHRDLFPRNLLVRATGGRLALFLLDAWRGGPGPGLRGPSYDLACFMLFGADLLRADEEAALFHAYFRERERRGVRCDATPFLRRAAKERARLLARFRRRRRPESVLPVPVADWNPVLLARNSRSSEP